MSASRLVAAAIVEGAFAWLIKPRPDHPLFKADLRALMGAVRSDAMRSFARAV
jgi:hypothetical protein